MRRIISLMAILALFTITLMATPAAKIQVCHMNGNGSFNQIEIAEAALGSHFDHPHGDFLVSASNPCPPATDPPDDPPPVVPPPVVPPVTPPPIEPPYIEPPYEPSTILHCINRAKQIWLASCSGLDQGNDLRIGSGWVNTLGKNKIEVRIVEDSPLGPTILQDVYTVWESTDKTLGDVCYAQSERGDKLLLYRLWNSHQGFGLLQWVAPIGTSRKCEMRSK